MSAKLLSQNEIDQLMTRYSGAGEESGQSEQQSEAAEKSSAAVKPAKEVINYDFKHPKLVSKEQMRSLRTLHEMLARNLSVALTNSLRTIVDVQLNAIDQVVYSEFVQSIASPSSLFLFTVEELGGEAVLELDPRFCIFAVERQTGGQSKEMAFRREMTTIEQKVMARIMNRMYSELMDAWEPYMEVNINEHSYESNPENIQIISAVEPAIVVFYQVKVYDSVATLNICYPYALLESALANSLKYANQTRKDDLPSDQRRAYTEHVKSINAPVQAILGSTKITIEQLVDLEEGDAITLDQRTDEPIEIKVNDRTKMFGYPGQHRKQKAVKIYDILEEEEENTGQDQQQPELAEFPQAGEQQNDQQNQKAEQQSSSDSAQEQDEEQSSQEEEQDPAEQRKARRKARKNRVAKRKKDKNLQEEES